MSVFRNIFRLLAGHDDDRHSLERAIKKLGESQRDQATRFENRLNELGSLLSQRSTRTDAIEILHAVRALGRDPKRPVGADGDEAFASAEKHLQKTLDALGKGTGPIVVGPWTGEVGFEILYWVPFLEWARTRWRLDPGRFVILSRGGVDSWYAMPGARYVDIFSLMPPATFRERTDSQEHKQRDISPFDREVIEMVSQREGLDSAGLLHPSLMYRTFAPFWRDKAGFALPEQFTCYRRLDPLDDPVIRTLPSEYIAARFYFSNWAFPDTPANRAAADAIIQSMAAEIPVVMLDPGLKVDDHSDYAPTTTQRIIGMPSGVSAERNLAVQSAIISHARAFVGTHGGYSYLAPLYGVPAISFYSKRGFKLHHLHLAQRVCDRLGDATVVSVDIADAQVLHAATGVRGSFKPTPHRVDAAPPPDPVGEETLVMTATFNVGETPFTVMQGEQDRAFQYLCALVSWAKATNVRRIVLGENSNTRFDFSSIVRHLENAGKEVEILVFDGNKEAARLGKGFGDGEILEYCFKHSKLIRQRGSFYKVTGRLFVSNFDLVSVRTVSPDAFRRKVREAGKPSKLNTAFFKCSLTLFESKLLHAYREVDEPNGVYLEHIYYNQLRDVDPPEFRVAANLVGEQASTGKLYQAYEQDVVQTAESLICV